MPTAKHTLEFPGGYTRSTGPIIGRFLTELRDGRLYGVRAPSGRVIVPAVEYDPLTGEAVTGEFVPVGPGGTVEAWTYVEEPRPEHPLDGPFAWALIKPDGADTAMLHALDAPAKAIEKGMRVRPRWRHERRGDITDISCFVPEVTSIVSPTRLDYEIRPGEALGRFLEGIASRRFLGSRCGSCHKVYVPPRTACPACGVPITEEVELPDTGTVTTYAVNNLPDPRAPEVPFVTAYVLLDRADVAFLTLIGDCPADRVEMGMRVKAVWADELRAEGGGRSGMAAGVKWFAPVETTGGGDA